MLGYTKYRHDFAKLIWTFVSPNWHYSDATFDRSAAAFTNPDHVAIVISDYRWRIRLVKDEPQYQHLEAKLDRGPVITVGAPWRARNRPPESKSRAVWMQRETIAARVASDSHNKMTDVNARRMASACAMLSSMKRIERLRLYPTRQQAARLRFMLDVSRELYNALLQQRRDAYRLRGIGLRAKQQYAELTELRREDGRVQAVYRECQDAVLHRLELAFAAFFRRVRAGETAGYPRFKPAARWAQLTFPHGGRALRLTARQTQLRVPGVGWVSLRKGRCVPAFGRGWLVVRNGRWYACLECERARSPLPNTGVTLGIDRGVHVLAACSDGRLIRNLRVGERRRRATTRLQRELEAVTQRDGAHRVMNGRDPVRVKAVLQLARAKEREANARRDYAHKLARRIVTGADVIALERLKLRAMTRSAAGTLECPGSGVRAKSGLNRVVLDAGFGLLDRLIAEKAEEAARMVVRVEARFSSQTCSRCGDVSARSRRRRRFWCVRCGLAAHADVNAALEIRRRAQLALLRKPDAGAEPVGQQDA